MSGSSSSRPRLGVVTPLANEESGIDGWLDRVLGQLDAGDRVYCVLDLASKDRTRERIAARAEQDERVRLVWAPENRSVVDAYFRGYREALADGCEWILEMDGGFSHLPEEIPRFVAAMGDGAEFAAGSRFTAGGTYRGFGTRYLISRGGSWLANLLLGTRMVDMTSGFECFSRDALTEVVARGTHSRAHFFQTEIRAMLHGRRWVEVPITYANPSKRLGRASLVDAFRSLWHLYRAGGRSTAAKDER